MNLIVVLIQSVKYIFQYLFANKAVNFSLQKWFEHKVLRLVCLQSKTLTVMKKIFFIETQQSKKTVFIQDLLQ